MLVTGIFWLLLQSNYHGMDTQLKPFDISTRTGFKTLYDSCYEPLAVYAMRMSLDRAEAEDVVQSVFVALWERRSTFDSESVARSYLYVSVRNRVIDLLHHHRVEDRYADHVSRHADVADDPDADDDFFTAEVYARLFRAIDGLSPRQREIFMMCMDGRRNRDIAQAMGIAEDTVRVQKRRAMHSLRKTLGAEELLLLAVLIG